MSKIIGIPVGTTLPKSDWSQTDPSKGDYIKNKPDVVDMSTFQTMVGDTPVVDQINAAIQTITVEDIDAICGVDDVTALVNAEFLFEAIDNEGNTLTDGADNTYVF